MAIDQQQMLAWLYKIRASIDAQIKTVEQTVGLGEKPLPPPAVLRVKGKPDLTPETIEWLRHQWSANISAAEAARMLGGLVSLPTVQKWYRRFKEQEENK